VNLEISKFTYRVTWSEEDDAFIGTCAEFPSLSWLDETPEEALKGIGRVVKECIDDLMRDNEDIPLGISSRQYSGKFMVRVPPEEFTSSVKS